MPEVQAHPEVRRVVTRQELQERFGINWCRQHLFLLERRGQFPKRIYISRRRSVYDEAEILTWLAARAAARLKSASADAGRPTP